VRIREYQKKRLFGGEAIATHPLDVPPLTYETTGLWIEIPRVLQSDLTADGLHFMGGIHALEHAAIGLFPLLAIADRGDVGGISYTAHPQLSGPAIFLYDGVPGGAGLAERAFSELTSLLEKTRELIDACPCDAGCPACIQSPRCGNGNKPLDKAAALRVLRVLLGETPWISRRACSLKSSCRSVRRESTGSRAAWATPRRFRRRSRRSLRPIPIAWKRGRF
jgi:DEAD/DEAH box helicase domain-containing protein